MYDNLTVQLHLCDLSKKEIFTGEEIIWSLDNDGYFKESIEAVLEDIEVKKRDTEFENVTSSNEMQKSMLQAMMLNANSSVGNVPIPGKKIDIPKGGGGLYIFNGDGNQNFNGDFPDEDDTSWLMG